MSGDAYFSKWIKFINGFYTALSLWNPRTFAFYHQQRVRWPHTVAQKYAVYKRERCALAHAVAYSHPVCTELDSLQLWKCAHQNFSPYLMCALLDDFNDSKMYTLLEHSHHTTIVTHWGLLFHHIRTITNLSQVHRIIISLQPFMTANFDFTTFTDFKKKSLAVFKWIITQQTSAIIFKSGFHKCAYIHEAIDLTQATMCLDKHLST